MALNDPDDGTLYLRLFLQGKSSVYGRYGYEQFVPLSPEVVSSSTHGFLVDFTLSGPCDALVNNQLGQYILELYASDREFVSEGDDLRLPTSDGQTDSVYWIMNCQPYLPSP